MSERLSAREKISYGLGDFGSCLIYSTQSYYLMYFYTNAIGISLVSAGTIMLIVRASSIFDPVVGVLVDRTETKWGKARPYVLWAALPLAVMTILTYNIPEFSPGNKVVYAGGTYLLMTLLYTLHNLPYGIMMQLMTKNQRERSTLAMFRMLGANCGMLLVSAATLPLVALIGKGNDRLGFAVVPGLYAALATVMFTITYANCRERVTARSRAGSPISVRTSLSALRKNRPWMILSANAMLSYIKTFFPTTMLLYFVVYYLGKGEVVASLFLTLGSVGKVLTTALTPRVAGRLGKKGAMLLGISLPMAGYLGGIAAGANLPLALLCYTVATVPTGFTMTLDYSMLPDTVEYGEWKTGVRTDGLTYSGFSLVTKLAAGIGSALVGYSLSLIGLDTEASVQSAFTLQGLRLLMYGVPALMAVLQLLVMRFYKLDEETCDRIVLDLEERAVEKQH